MQSSALLAVRAFIMLVFLIAVPLVAIFGAALPEFIKGVADGYSATSGPGTSGDTRRRAPPHVEPKFAGSRFEPALSTSPPGRFETPHKAYGLAEPRPSEQPVSVAPAEGMRVGFNEPAAINVTAAAGQLATQQPPLRAPNSTSEVNFDVQEQQPEGAGLAQFSAARTIPELEHRLQELGASYYRLESWGSGSPMYKFYCMVEANVEAAQDTHFQALEATAEAAMSQVVRQLENWRGAAAR